MLKMVPGGGLEPPWDCSLRILSPLRLPISPSGHASILWDESSLLGRRFPLSANRLADRETRENPVIFPQLAPERKPSYHPARVTTMSDLESKTGLRVKGRLMSASEIERTLVRLAHEIVEKSNGSEDLALVGIKRRGVPLAERLGKLISTIEKRPVDTGVLDIQFYRDDLTTAGARPVVTPGAVGCAVEGRDIVICDDVLFTGRTVRAALDALFDHGRPRRVQLAVLIDRGHRELPIEATYVGKHVPTSKREIIEVKFLEVDATEEVLLVERPSE